MTMAGGAMKKIYISQATIVRCCHLLRQHTNELHINSFNWDCVCVWSLHSWLPLLLYAMTTDHVWVFTQHTQSLVITQHPNDGWITMCALARRFGASHTRSTWRIHQQLRASLGQRYNISIKRSPFGVAPLSGWSPQRSAIYSHWKSKAIIVITGV